MYYKTLANNSFYTTTEIQRIYRQHLCRFKVIYLSSSLGLIGIPSDAPKITNSAQLAEFHLNLILNELRPDQTLLIPAFTYTFGGGSNNFLPVFNKVVNTPTIGPLPKAAFESKVFDRSIEPFLSTLVLGTDSKYLISELPYTSYGHDSLFSRLRSLDVGIVSVGLGSHWLPFLHHLDFLLGTPFRYSKKFFGILSDVNPTLPIEWSYDVRLVIENTYPSTYKLAAISNYDTLSETHIGRSSISSYDYNKTISTSIPLMLSNPWISVKGPPLQSDELVTFLQREKASIS